MVGQVREKQNFSPTFFMEPIVVDLTIDLSGLNTQELLSEWRWRVSEDYVPIQMTKFGDWFLSDPLGRVHLLELIEGTLQQVAPSVAAYNALKDTREMHDGWFFDGLVFQCVEEGLLLNEGECYGWNVHPVIGGTFEFANIKVYSLSVYQSLMGQIFRQYHQSRPEDPIPPLKMVRP